jgi:sirohydrochlorin cobaltochelatase
VTDLDAVVLVGHGGVPRDFPRPRLVRLKALESERRARGGTPSAEEVELETAIRRWARTPATDPYQTGLERLATHLRPLLAPARLVLAYNEFCAPALAEAVATLVAEGCRRIAVVPSMLTPGGVHSEVEIPEEIVRLRERFPQTTIDHAWPFDPSAVATLLATQVALRSRRGEG